MERLQEYFTKSAMTLTQAQLKIFVENRTYIKVVHFGHLLCSPGGALNQ